MDLGMVGLGRMGGNMAERLRRAGHRVVGYSPHSPAADVHTLAELVAALEPPRVVWCMVPAGEATEVTVVELAGMLAPSDTVVEGGNSRWTDSVRRAGLLAEAGVGFVDAGVSGGVWGLDNGYALMVGGDDDDVRAVWPLLESLAPEGAAAGGRGLAHVGPVGAGHFAKMVHNGIEYGIMQAFGEGVELLARHPVGVDVPAALRAWQEGSVIRSWLLDLLVLAHDAHPGLADLDDFAADSGEGRWAVQAAVDAGVPMPVLTAALFARFGSQQDSSLALRAVAALREQFGGHAIRAADPPPPTD